ncbi:hypothetical protein [Halostella pelagica]|uniref:hypothetical protein n=1 Tax=Halostella pelagica TaxID=2583824 RepID=UPI0010815919|nr:hypothetical protein [Halostella pelagica]
MTRHTDQQDDRIDQELACLRGHAEARERLADHGWPEEDIETLESSMSFREFAAAVADELRWRRAHQ